MVINGKNIADEIRGEIKKSIAELKSPRKPGLAFLLVGEHAPSHTYVNMKKKACADVGIESHVFELPEAITEPELLEKIDSLNRDSAIDGILVQLPLPSHINEHRITLAIDPTKDVDGFHPINVGKLLLGQTDGFVPCTPLGIKVLLERAKIQVEKRHVVIVGRSNIVGKPLAALLIQKMPHCNATVTIAHSHTQNLPELTRQADILIAAIGRPRFITADMVREGAVVIDVGINREATPSGPRLVGDVDFENVEKKCPDITPVPKGVGPMTVTMLLQNTLQSFLRRQ
ncbi:MAG: Bifunctional protein FolD protein [Chlamydiae bacterium]|nr:Bifunctional protein FolD protein [Chlamydiota bacterium]